MSEYVEALGMPATDVQGLLARIDLMTETIVVTCYEGGRAVTTYEIAPDSLAAAFSGLPMATGLLPRDCLFYAKEGMNHRVGVFLPAGRRELTVVGLGDGPVTLSVPLPPLVFAGTGTVYAVFAVKRRPDRDEQLYHAPLPNVYSDGRICPGNAEFPACTTATIHKAARVFFESAFNYHLVNRKSQSHPDDVTELWKVLVELEQDNWPLEDLEETPLTMRALAEGAWRWRA